MAILRTILCALGLFFLSSAFSTPVLAEDYWQDGSDGRTCNGKCKSPGEACQSVVDGWWPGGGDRAVLLSCTRISDNQVTARTNGACCGVVYSASPVLFCDAGRHPDEGAALCVPDAGAGPNNGDSCCGNPIALSEGNKFQIVNDFSTSGAHPLAFTRYYNSQGAARTYTFKMPLGMKWQSNFDRYMQNNSSSVKTFYRYDGSIIKFTLVGSVWTPPTDLKMKLVKVGSDWHFTDLSDVTEIYDANYRLLSITTRDGYVQTPSYDANGNMTGVTDSYGRTLVFTYTGARLTKVTAPGGLEIGFIYDSSYAFQVFEKNRLIGVTEKNVVSGVTKKKFTYLFEDARFPGYLTGITDGNGVRFATWAYNADGRAILSKHAGDAEEVNIVYGTDGTRTVTDARGQVMVHTFQTVTGRKKLISVTRQASGSVPAATRTQTYDSNGFLATVTDFDGNLTTYVRDARGLETSRTEADGSPEERTITTTWHATLRVPTQIVQPGVTADFVWDSNGRLTSRTETDTTGGPSNGQTRVWTFTWTTAGLLETVDGPRSDLTDTTTYAYDAAGFLSSVTNALAQVTEITSVNARGLPLTIEDVNGIVTTLSYDIEGRLTSSSTSGALTKYQYDNVGQLIALTEPNGNRTTYEYDDARRLTALENNRGERVEFTLNAMGDRTEMKVKSDSGAILRSQTQTFDTLGRLLTSVGAASQTTAYEYDDNGNTIEITDPRSAVTQQAFDGLNRLVSTTDALTGVTTLTNDSADNLTTVEDPDGRTTSYVYNGFGEIIQQTSPDTGVTTYGRDAAGNITTETDARSVVKQSAYDALNRITARTFPASAGENVSFGYDSVAGGNYGIGRLTSVTDETGSTSYIYDAKGNVLSESLVVGAVSYQTSFTYDAADHLIRIVYPSGQIVSYDRDDTGLIRAVYSQASATAPPIGLASSIQYLPFGPVQSLVFGNSTKLTYSYDQDYRLTGIETEDGSTDLQKLTLAYDGADNITAITDTVDAARNQILEYDLLSRLTDASGAYGAEAYTYDGVANRATRQIDINSTTTNVTYAYITGTNRLQSASNGTDTRSFTYDAAGNVTDEAINSSSAYSYIYNANNRMAQVTANGTLVNYKYNAFGERVIRAVSGGDTTHSFFGRNGELIAETDDLGNPLKSYVYINGLPIAQILPSSATPVADVTLDDDGSGTSSTGTWTASTDGTGFEGTGHKLVSPPDPTNGGTVVDNTSPGFSSVGKWDAQTTPTGFVGTDYLKRDASSSNSTTITVDNSDAGFTSVAPWISGSFLYAMNGTSHYANKSIPSSTASIADNADATKFSTTGVWTLGTSSGKYGSNYRWIWPTVSPESVIIDDGDAGYTQTANVGWTNVSSTLANSGDYRRFNLSNLANIVDNSSATNFSTTGTWTVSTAGTSSEKYGTNFLWHAGQQPSPQATILDNTSPEVTSTGTWSPSTTVSGYYGSNYFYHSASTDTTDEFVYPLEVPSAGKYRVYLRWVVGTARPTNAKYTITHANGSTEYTIDQESRGGAWQFYGIFDLAPASGHKVTISGISNDAVVADAIAYEAAAPTPSTATWSFNVASAGDYAVWARWRAYSDRATNAVYRISHAGGTAEVPVNQKETTGTWRYLGTYSFAAGVPTVTLNDEADGTVIADAVALDPVLLPTTNVQWTPTLPAAGQYNVYASWVAGIDRSDSAKFVVQHDGGATDVSVNQTLTPVAGTDQLWYLLGTYNMSPGQNHGVTLAANADGSVIADGIAFEPVGGAPNKAIFRPEIATADEYNLWAMWHADSRCVANAPYTVFHDGGQTTVNANQQTDNGVWKLLGTFNFSPGNDQRIELADRLPDGSPLADGWCLIADAVAIEPTSSMGNVARWTPTFPQADRYEVTARWPYKNSGATNAHYIVTHAGGTTSVLIDQSKPSARHPEQVNERVSLGVFDFLPGAGHKVELSDLANGALIADSMQWAPVPAPDRVASWQGTVTNGGDYRLMVRWPSSPDLAPNAKYTVTTPGGASSVTLDQSQGGGTWHPLKTVTLAANDNWRVDLSDRAAGPVAADAVVAVPVGTLDAFTWAPTLPSAGTYQVFAKWPSLSDLASDAVYKVIHEGGVAEVALSQKQGGGTWRYLGSWDFDPAHSPNVKLQASLLGQVSADAVRFVKQSTSGGVSYIISDQVAQPQKMTDQAGTVTWDRVSSPFGETAQMAAGGSSDLAHRFPGQQDDPTTGLAYNYFRDYDPSLGRYVQSDPIGLAGGLSTYAYVGGNPVSYVDPTGENPIIVAMIVGAGTGAALSLLDELANNCWDIDRVDWWNVGAGAAIGGATGPLLEFGILARYGGRGIGLLKGLGSNVGKGAAKGSSGIAAGDGTIVSGFTKHGINRAIGDGGKRAGTKPGAILDALKNPKSIKSGIDNQGRPYNVYNGESARVVVNPATGKVISTNPLSGIGAN